MHTLREKYGWYKMATGESKVIGRWRAGGEYYDCSTELRNYKHVTREPIHRCLDRIYDYIRRARGQPDIRIARNHKAERAISAALSYVFFLLSLITLIVPLAYCAMAMMPSSFGKYQQSPVRADCTRLAEYAGRNDFTPDVLTDGVGKVCDCVVESMPWLGTTMVVNSLGDEDGPIRVIQFVLNIIDDIRSRKEILRCRKDKCRNRDASGIINDLDIKVAKNPDFKRSKHQRIQVKKTWMNGSKVYYLATGANQILRLLSVVTTVAAAVLLRKYNTWREHWFTLATDSLTVFLAAQTIITMFFKIVDSDDNVLANTIFFRREAKSLEDIYEGDVRLRARALATHSNIRSLASKVNTCFLNVEKNGVLPSARGILGSEIATIYLVTQDRTELTKADGTRVYVATNHISRDLVVRRRLENVEFYRGINYYISEETISATFSR